MRLVCYQNCIFFVYNLHGFGVGGGVKTQKSGFCTHQVLLCLAVRWMCIFLVCRKEILPSSPATHEARCQPLASVPPAPSRHISEVLFEAHRVESGCVRRGGISFPSETYTPSDPDGGRICCAKGLLRGIFHVHFIMPKLTVVTSYTLNSYLSFLKFHILFFV